DIFTVLRNNTFKGVGASIEYQPGFLSNGITTAGTGGFTFKHDFDLNPSNDNTLTADYFISSTNNLERNYTNSKTTFTKAETLLSNGLRNAQTATNIQNFKTTYENMHRNINYSLSAGIKLNRNGATETQTDSVSYSRAAIQSMKSLNSFHDLNSELVELN